MSQTEVRLTDTLGTPAFFENLIWTSKRPSRNATIAPANRRRRAGVSL
jgi:hypothetical protein